MQSVQALSKNLDDFGVPRSAVLALSTSAHSSVGHVSKPHKPPHVKLHALRASDHLRGREGMPWKNKGNHGGCRRTACLFGCSSSWPFSWKCSWKEHETTGPHSTETREERNEGEEDGKGKTEEK